MFDSEKEKKNIYIYPSYLLPESTEFCLNDLYVVPVPRLDTDDVTCMPVLLIVFFDLCVLVSLLACCTASRLGTVLCMFFFLKGCTATEDLI